MSNRLQGRTALVTGSTTGIGKAIAQFFAHNGAQVVVTGRRAELGEGVAAEIRQDGGKAAYVYADLANDEDVAGLIQSTIAEFGTLDIVVNNAALIPRRPDGALADGPIHRTESDYWEQAWQVDLRSIFLACKLAMPYLLRSDHASIIHIASANGVAGCGMDVYSAFKGALIALARSMAVSYAHRVRVNTISPGVVIVERTEELWHTVPEMEQQARTEYLTPVGRAADIAHCAVYLASDEASYVTGANFVIDGGMTIKGALPPGPASVRSTLQMDFEYPHTDES